jgi:hypothetical protein
LRVTLLSDLIPISISSIADAIEYLKPANIRGGISTNPNLIITQEEDQSTVTKHAWITAIRRILGEIRTDNNYHDSLVKLKREYVYIRRMTGV